MLEKIVRCVSGRDREVQMSKNVEKLLNVFANHAVNVLVDLANEQL